MHVREDLCSIIVTGESAVHPFQAILGRHYGGSLVIIILIWKEHETVHLREHLHVFVQPATPRFGATIENDKVLRLHGLEHTLRSRKICHVQGIRLSSVRIQRRNEILRSEDAVSVQHEQVGVVNFRDREICIVLHGP